MSKRILVIEDNKLNRQMTRSTLEQAGYGVIEAADADEAAGKLAESSVDLIVLDLVLPGKDGFQILEELKRDEKTSDIPVIVMTMRDDKEELARCRQLGAFDCLIKYKIKPAQLLSSVKTALI